MNRLFVAALLVAGAVAGGPVNRVAFADQAPDAAVEADLRERIRLWDSALRLRNLQVLGRLLADDFTLTDANGVVFDKNDYLLSVANTPAYRGVASFASEAVAVTIDGESATVSGRSQLKGRPRGVAWIAPGTYEFTDRWVKVGGEWRAASTTAVRLPS